jgi:hypothetical protein
LEGLDLIKKETYQRMKNKVKMSFLIRNGQSSSSKESILPKLQADAGL